MAEATTDTTDDLPPKTGPSNWLLIVEYVYPRWLVRLRSSKDAKDELEALLRDTETRSRKYQVDANGKEVPGTSSYPDAEYWQDRLKLEPDDDGGDDHLVIDYAEYEDIYLPDRHWESVVRRLDVERWEHLYPELAAPPPRPLASHAPDQTRVRLRYTVDDAPARIWIPDQPHAAEACGTGRQLVAGRYRSRCALSSSISRTPATPWTSALVQRCGIMV